MYIKFTDTAGRIYNDFVKNFSDVLVGALNGTIKSTADVQNIMGSVVQDIELIDTVPVTAYSNFVLDAVHPSSTFAYTWTHSKNNVSTGFEMYVLLTAGTRISTSLFVNDRQRYVIATARAESVYNSTHSIISVSDNHIFISFRGLVGFWANHVRNDASFAKSSRYKPSVVLSGHFTSTSTQAHGLQSVSPLYNVATNGDDFPGAVNFDTPYAVGTVTPQYNGGYDYLGSDTERTPLLVPFGASYAPGNSPIGSITDLTDIYLGPTVGENFDSVSVGDFDFVQVIIPTLGTFYIPKR